MVKASSKLDKLAQATWKIHEAKYAQTPEQRDWLEVYCANMSTYWQCEASIQKLGRLVNTERGSVKINPEFTIQSQSYDRMLKAAKALGMTDQEIQTEDTNEIEEFFK